MSTPSVRMSSEDAARAILDLMPVSSVTQEHRNRCTYSGNGHDGGDPTQPARLNVGEFIGALTRESRLSTGERVLVDIAAAVWNGSLTARLTSITLLDMRRRAKVMAILTDTWT